MKGLREIVAAAVVTAGLTPSVYAGTSDDVDNLGYAVPRAEMFSTTAQDLTAEQVDELTGFYFNIGSVIQNFPRENPITINGDDVRKIIQKYGPSILREAELLRSGFYSSQNGSLESGRGVFNSQAATFPDEDKAENFKNKVLNSNINYCRIVMDNDNTIGVLVMLHRYEQPTQEFQELVDYAQDNGFTITPHKTCPSPPQ